MATGIVVCWFVCLFVTRGARGRPQSVGLLPEARVGGHGYSSMLVVCLSVCLFVCHRYIYSDTALRLQHG